MQLEIMSNNMPAHYTNIDEAVSKALSYALLIVLTIMSSCVAKDKIYYVNPNRVLRGYHGAITQHESFKSKAQNWQRRIDSLSAEIRILKNESLTVATAKEQQFLRYQQAIQQQAQQENQRLTKTVLDEINAYIKQYGKQKGYTFILGATETGNIVYAAEGTDITNEVLKGLNEQYDRQHPAATP